MSKARLVITAIEVEGRSPAEVVAAQDLHIGLVNAATGELLHELTLDPSPRLPAHRRPQRAQKTPEMTTAEPTVAGPAVPMS